MPNIQSAKKRAKQTEKKTQQLRPFKTKMLTLIKNIIKWVKGGETDKAIASLSQTYKAIDTAAKKKIIKKNTANRRKSLIQRAVNNAKKDPSAKAPEKVKVVAPKKVVTEKKTPITTKKAPAKKTVAKKAPAKKAPAKKAKA